MIHHEHGGSPDRLVGLQRVTQTRRVWLADLPGKADAARIACPTGSSGVILSSSLLLKFQQKHRVFTLPMQSSLRNKGQEAVDGGLCQQVYLLIRDRILSG